MGAHYHSHVFTLMMLCGFDPSRVVLEGCVAPIRTQLWPREGRVVQPFGSSLLWTLRCRLAVARSATVPPMLVFRRFHPHCLPQGGSRPRSMAVNLPTPTPKPDPFFLGLPMVSPPPQRSPKDAVLAATDQEGKPRDKPGGPGGSPQGDGDGGRFTAPAAGARGPHASEGLLQWAGIQEAN